MVENLGDQSSDFLRVELKKLPLQGTQKPVRGPVPDPLKAGGTDEFKSSELLIRRLVCDLGQPCNEPPAKGPMLLVAISSLKASLSGVPHAMKNGDVQWVSTPGQLSIEAAASAPAHLLEIEWMGPVK